MRPVRWLVRVVWDGLGLVVVYALLVLVELLPDGGPGGSPTRPAGRRRHPTPPGPS
jgi:hypothetical protein